MVNPDPCPCFACIRERALAKSETRTRKAEALVELQKKVSELLGIQLPTPDEEP